MQIKGSFFDTHAFVKAFVNAKTDEEKAEILAKTISETREENLNKVEQKFDRTKDELVTKLYLDNKLKEVNIKLEERFGEVDVKLKNLEIKMYIALGSLAAFLTTMMLGVLPFILKAWAK